eukprot:1196261-Prorocentrum_minimum.AAC.5
MLMGVTLTLIHSKFKQGVPRIADEDASGLRSRRRSYSDDDDDFWRDFISASQRDTLGGGPRRVRRWSGPSEVYRQRSAHVSTVYPSCAATVFFSSCQRYLRGRTPAGPEVVRALGGLPAAQ